MNQIEYKPINYKYHCSNCENELPINDVYNGLCSICNHEFDNSDFEIVIDLPFKPLPKKSVRVNTKTGTVYNASHPEMKVVKDYLEIVYKSYCIPKDIPLRVSIECYLCIPKSWNGKEQMERWSFSGRIKPISKPDIDNILKFINDCLSGIAWNDDRQITIILASKRYAEKESILIKINFDS